MLQKALLYVMLATSGGDTTTSLMGFHRGAVELNPTIISTRPVPFTVQMTATAGVEAYMIHKLSKRHPKWAIAATIAQIGVSSYCIGNNVWVYREQGRINDQSRSLHGNR